MNVPTRFCDLYYVLVFPFYWCQLWDPTNHIQEKINEITTLTLWQRSSASLPPTAASSWLSLTSKFTTRTVFSNLVSRFSRSAIPLVNVNNNKLGIASTTNQYHMNASVSMWVATFVWKRGSIPLQANNLSHNNLKNITNYCFQETTALLHKKMRLVIAFLSKLTSKHEHFLKAASYATNITFISC